MPTRKQTAPVSEIKEDAFAKTMTATAHLRLRQLILDNKWAPGYQATEQEVASQLGMSRTPVREALMRLQQDGLVSVIPRHGMRVLPISISDMKEIYEILTSLESTAAELAASRQLSEDQLRGLEKATADMDHALSQDDLERWAQADARFHEQLLELGGNQMLKSVVLNFIDRAHRVRMVTLKMRPKPVNSTREHAELVQAIREGDREKARNIHKAHRERAGKELLDLLERLGLNHL
ncbi:GntR family transcriptional regulator [Rhizobium sophorae]|uniref:GntR family transcriptional regulator protein n=8 Tax=Rhizobium TaxID=379 RepID=A0A0B4X5M6_9HYPH|nr:MULTISPECIES: GntR family transcriptional regulator [Rhizobium]AJD43409.1 GntR family transcriptional regulator protein [Rhizobium gallicum bv. gallicum R602sp]ANL30214.1 GntR family transcriptional regulator protein [Rhizobium phaseoli]APO69901.1 GntR family transcriptional regulator protein [Rhizobium gallicum]KPH05133.1 GntR family transcriptional regulator [Rhizobium acidisoli]MDR9774856.1 GntR family transcriptional regulator [Rhizobium hidalgonense]